MADRTVDDLLDAGAASLQYFKVMLDIAAAISTRDWPDWTDGVCRPYDFERGIDLAALRGDASMLRAQAAVARRVCTDQAAASGEVERAWPDAAGRAAVQTLATHQRRSEPTVVVLENTAAAAEGVADAVVKAVSGKIDRLSEFSQSALTVDGVGPLASIGSWLGNPASAHLLANLAGQPMLVFQFEQQLQQDLNRFSAIITETRAAIRDAYAKVAAAAGAAEAAPFPAPSFGPLTAGGVGLDEPAGPAAPAGPRSSGLAPAAVPPVAGTAATSGAGRSGGAGGGMTGGTGGTGRVRGGVPAPAATPAVPPVTSPAAAPAAAPAAPPVTAPTATPASTAPTATPAGTAPSGGTPATGLSPGAMPAGGLGTGAQMPAWLSKLLPEITDRLGLGQSGEQGGGAGGPADKSGDRPGAKDSAGPGAEDTAGRSGPKTGDGAGPGKVTATLSPDGKTVEVTVRKPDGTEQHATLRVGDDGKLTCADATADRSEPTATAPEPDGAQKPVAPEPDLVRRPDQAQEPVPPAPAGSNPSGSSQGGSSQSGSSQGGATAGTAPSAGAPPIPERAPDHTAPVTPPPSAPAPGRAPGPAAGAAPGRPAGPGGQGARPSAAAEECPPAEPGSGAEFATTVP
ncbi:hypothetical protein GCM10027289_11030 [Tsukamurella serpentis]